MTTYIGNTPAGAKDIIAQLPIGAMVSWASAKLPLGWIECNGQSTAQYPELAGIVGANVPDLRGEFIRGWDNGRGIDVGRALGSAQADEFEAHGHILNGRSSENGGSADATGSFTTPRVSVLSRGADANPTTAGDAIDQTGSNETRPRNIAQMYIIKAFNVVSEGQVSGFISPNKNYIINPTFSINQRVFAGGSVNGGAYNFDRFRGAGGGDASTVTLPDADGFVTIVSSGANQGLQQRVEKFGYAGAMTLSWEGTSLAQFFDANGGSWSDPAPSPIVFNATETGNIVPDALELLLWGTGTLKNAKLETGSIATPFEYPDVGSELEKCKRYYEKSYSQSQPAGTITSAGAMYEPTTRNSGTVSHGFRFSVTKRASPTVVLYSTITGVAGTVDNGGQKVAVASAIGDAGVRFLSITSGTSAVSLNYQFTADAEL